MLGDHDHRIARFQRTGTGWDDQLAFAVDRHDLKCVFQVQLRKRNTGNSGSMLNLELQRFQLARVELIHRLDVGTDRVLHTSDITDDLLTRQLLGSDHGIQREIVEYRSELKVAQLRDHLGVRVDLFDIQRS